MRAPGLDWPSANGSWIGMMGGFGSSLRSGEDRSSTSHYPSENTSPAGPAVLVVEDNESDVFLIQEAIDGAKLIVTIHVVNDGEQAVQFFDRADEDMSMPCPSLIILDINLPKKQGREVLKHLRESRRCSHALVIVVSTSVSSWDRKQMEQLGADEYFRKPSDYEEFMRLGAIVRELLERLPRL